jgi:dTDP-4-amino-4,6-dideoxygalactose transaminase
MKVPFVDLKAQYVSIQAEIDAAIREIISNTTFIGGKPVNDFEAAFAELYGINNCISVANGTDSLYIIMKMLGIGAGDEVITVANSWISTSETISQTGAKPVFLDIDPDYYSLNEQLLEAAITPNTKAIMPVHLHGQAVNMDEVMRIADKYKLPVIEDCAQSHFSEFKGRRVGTFGIAASFSFYPGKNLGAYGDAGAIITSDAGLAEKCKMYARHGALKKHEHQIEGINSRLDGLQASILSVKLPHILEWTAARIRCADAYDQLLSDIPEIVTPKRRADTRHSYHLYVIRAKNRDGLANFLKERNIETAIHYPTALPNLKAYAYLGHKAEDFPIATAYQSQIISLPIYPELTSAQMEYVVESIKSFYS